MPETIERQAEAKVTAKKSTPYGRFALIAITLIALVAIMFVAGYLPRQKRERGIQAEAHEEETSLPVVNVAKVKPSPPTDELQLPGSTTPVTEAYIFARASGYVKKRYVDIGDRVRQGQILAEIDAPDLDQQVLQAEAALSQAQAALGQAQASLDQARSQEHLADVTNTRWKTLVSRGVLSKQEGDQRQAEFDNASAVVRVAAANVKAAQDNIRAVDANLNRLKELQGYKSVRAPFTGVVTSRSIDTGSFINASGSGQGTPVFGSTSGPANGSEMFRVAQSDVLRILVNVPQAYASGIRVGMPAKLTLQENASRNYDGKVTRTASSIDPNTRTLLTEVQIVNKDGSLLPGMYGNLHFVSARSHPPLLIPGDSLVVGSNGPHVAVVGEGGKVHFQAVQLGRDYGAEIEITSGLQGGETVVVNPGDDVREGQEVKAAAAKPAAKPASAVPTQNSPAPRTKSGNE
jgi:multidrug efflux pump subunit AcrA (membrane-fusion protein)